MNRIFSYKAFTGIATGLSLLAGISPVLAQTTTYTSAQGSASSGAAVAVSTCRPGLGILCTLPPTPPTCPYPIPYNLYQGSASVSVSTLQQFLGVRQSGYFGATTRAAVRNWQSAHSLPASGYVGAMTRKAIANWWCGGSGGLSATPQSGVAPLTVNFSAGEYVGDNASYSVNFGDGQSAAMQGSTCAGISAVVGGRGGILCTYSTSHIYTSAGTYSATLIKQFPPPFCPPGSMCPMVMPASQIIGTITITVTNGTVSGNFTANPQSGNAPLPVYFRYDNGGTSGSYMVDFGDGSSRVMQAEYPPCVASVQCTVYYDVSHTYQNPGTYTAMVENYASPCLTGTGYSSVCNMPAQIIYGTVAITVTGSSGSSGAPTISGLDAPSSLAVGQTGTWTVHATVPNNLGAQLNYSVHWGDEGTQIYGSTSAAPATVQTSATFTHVYQQSGTYTPTFTVSNGSGSAQGSATVVVGGASSQQTFTIPGSVTLSPGGSAVDQGIWFTDTLTLNAVHPSVYGGNASAAAADFTWSESHCGTAGCLGIADSAPQNFTLYLYGYGGTSYTSMLNHIITLSAVGSNTATVQISQ